MQLAGDTRAQTVSRKSDTVTVRKPRHDRHIPDGRSGEPACMTRRVAGAQTYAATCAGSDQSRALSELSWILIDRNEELLHGRSSPGPGARRRAIEN
jgi:hypothetical protein